MVVIVLTGAVLTVFGGRLGGGVRTGRPTRAVMPATCVRRPLWRSPDQEEDPVAFRIGKGVQVLPFPEVLSVSVWEYLVQLVELGALVSLGASRDKGAVKVTVTVGGEWDFEWCRSEEELCDWLREAVTAVELHTPEPPTKSRRRTAA